MTFTIQLILYLPLLWWQPTFKENQLKNVRVKNAYQEKEADVKEYFLKSKTPYKGFQLFIRAFKKAQELEVWVKGKDNSMFELLTTYPFCTSSGTLGPKRKEGDGQIPEGIYYINHFNHVSNFHLSLGINYPNASDKILGDKVKPGSLIYLHGNCVTIGCIPITDDKIKELYVLAVEAQNNGQQKIPVHIFPDRLQDDESLQQLIAQFNPNSSTVTFWKNLQSINKYFESTRSLKPIRVNHDGTYTF